MDTVLCMPLWARIVKTSVSYQTPEARSGTTRMMDGHTLANSNGIYTKKEEEAPSGHVSNKRPTSCNEQWNTQDMRPRPWNF